jgi:hypothetical protein
MNKGGSKYIRCELPDGTTASIPGWMTNADICARMSEGDPTISLDALTQLRPLIDTWLRDSARPAATGSGERPGPGSPRSRSKNRE